MYFYPQSICDWQNNLKYFLNMWLKIKTNEKPTDKNILSSKWMLIYKFLIFTLK